MIIDSPDETENDNYLELFAKKGYAYSKLLIYVIDERKTLDADSMKNNQKLETLIKLRLQYKIPILILLTHFDNYCDEIKKTEKDWKEICNDNLYKNKKDLLDYINEDIIKKKYNQEFEFSRDDILHIVLVEPKRLTDEDIIETLKEDIKEEYNKADEEKRKEILKYVKSGMDLKDKEVQEFLKEKKIYDQSELIKKLKDKFPHQYHNALIQVEEK